MQDVKHKRQRTHVRREAVASQLVLTVPQAAALLGRTERATWLAIYRNRLPHRRHGRSVFLLRDELETFLKRLDGVSIEDALEHAARND